MSQGIGQVCLLGPVLPPVLPGRAVDASFRLFAFVLAAIFALFGLVPSSLQAATTYLDLLLHNVIS
jgi:hypothetical protein